MEQITNLLTYQSKSPAVRLGTYWTEIALSALATHVVFQRLQPSLTTLTMMGVGGTGYMITLLAIGKETSTQKKINACMSVRLGFVAGFQAAALGRAFWLCRSGAFAKALVAPALLLASTEAILFKGFGMSVGLAKD